MGRFLDWWIGAPPAPVEAAAATVALARPASGGARSPLFGWADPPFAPVDFPDAPPWFDRDYAMSIGTLARCRDLICSTIAQLPFTLWVVDLSTTPAVERRIPGASWFDRPDPDRTRQWLLAWTVDDLFFYERAYWLVTDRYADSYPRSFRRIPPGDLQQDGDRLTVTDDAGHRTPVAPRNVIEFLAADDGILSKGWRVISTHLRLDEAADRFAANEIPAGVLEEQDLGQEDITAEELGAIAAQFTEARRTNTTAATNRYLKYVPTRLDAAQMQLVEGRSYQALEIARLCDVPPYLVGAPAGTGMTYLNTETAHRDLIDFGCQSYITTIEQTLSGPNVTPRGQAVRLDLNVWLRNPFTTTAEPSPADVQIVDPTQPPSTPPSVVTQ